MAIEQASQSRPIKQTDRVRIGPMVLDRLALDDAVERIEAAVQGKGQLLHVVTANTQFLGQAQKNAEFARVVCEAGMVVADGTPLRWLCRLQRATPGPRITGHDLLHACAALAASRAYSIGFLGAGRDIAAQAAEHLKASYPGLRIAGLFQGNFNPDGSGKTEADEQNVAAAIGAARPDILFVALGCPKQEFWIHRNARTIGVPVSIGVGGVLDVLAGRFSRAPAWAQRSGMEWLCRLAQEPGRLWKRYLLQDIPTIALIAVSTIRRGPIDESAQVE